MDFICNNSIFMLKCSEKYTLTYKTKLSIEIAMVSDGENYLKKCKNYSFFLFLICILIFTIPRSFSEGFLDTRHSASILTKN